MKRLLRGLLVLGVFLGGTRTEGARAACQLGKQGTQGKELVPTLIEDLRSKYIGVRSSAAVSLGELGPDAKEAIPALIEALRDKEEVHDRAVYALGKIGSAGLPLLIQALGDKDARVRAGIAEALGDMGQGAKPAASALLKVSTDPDPHVREQIAWTLGHLQDKVSVPALIERLRTDSDADVRRAAAWALGQFSPPAREVISPLIQALRDPDDFSARQKLGPPLTMSVRDRSRWSVQDFARESLSKIGSAAVPAVLELLKDPDRNQRSSAVWILSMMGSEAKAAVPVLVETLQDKDLRLREDVAVCLGEIGPQAESAVPALRLALRDNSNRVRVCAARALTKIDPGNRDGVVTLIKELPDEESGAGSWAEYALRTIGKGRRHEVVALLKAFRNVDGKVARGAWYVPVPSLIDALQDDEETSRALAAEALGAYGSNAKTAIPALTTALRDTSPEVREKAASSLARILLPLAHGS